MDVGVSSAKDFLSAWRLVGKLITHTKYIYPRLCCRYDQKFPYTLDLDGYGVGQSCSCALHRRLAYTSAPEAFQTVKHEQPQ